MSLKIAILPVLLLLFIGTSFAQTNLTIENQTACEFEVTLHYTNSPTCNTLTGSMTYTIAVGQSVPVTAPSGVWVEAQVQPSSSTGCTTIAFENVGSSGTCSCQGPNFYPDLVPGAFSGCDFCDPYSVQWDDCGEILSLF